MSMWSTPDLQSYFDTIPHDRLMAQVARKISDGGVLALIEGCLRHGVMKEMEHGVRRRERRKGR
jgi:retron-type reverse transcriptase